MFFLRDYLETIATSFSFAWKDLEAEQNRAEAATFTSS